MILTRFSLLAFLCAVYPIAFKSTVSTTAITGLSSNKYLFFAGHITFCSVAYLIKATSVASDLITAICQWVVCLTTFFLAKPGRHPISLALTTRYDTLQLASVIGKVAILHPTLVAIFEYARYSRVVSAVALQRTFCSNWKKCKNYNK